MDNSNRSNGSSRSNSSSSSSSKNPHSSSHKSASSGLDASASASSTNSSSAGRTGNSAKATPAGPPSSAPSTKSTVTDNTTTTASHNNSKVRFDQVFIHEFPIILGDNPSVSKGAPLTLDWKALRHDAVELDMYEYLRAPERKDNRRRLILSNNRRMKMYVTFLQYCCW